MGDFTKIVLDKELRKNVNNSTTSCAVPNYHSVKMKAVRIIWSKIPASFFYKVAKNKFGGC